MIKNSVLVFVILLAGHVAIVNVLFTKPDPKDYEAANLALGRQYLTNSDQFKCVIVGSSMGAKIDASTMPLEAFNLSFTGRGAFDGLRLVQHSGAKPDIVLVELNTIFRDENKDFTLKLTNPYSRFLARGSHEMPVNYLIEFSAYLKRWCAGGNSPSSADEPANLSSVEVVEAMRVAGDRSGDDGSGDRDDDGFAKIVQSNISKWQSLPDYYPLDENLEVLNDYIVGAAERGTRVILFEMPCHPQIANSPRFQILRDGITRHPQLKAVPIVRVDDLTGYHSNDGLHLVYESRERFSMFLADQIQLTLSDLSHAD